MITEAGAPGLQSDCNFFCGHLWIVIFWNHNAAIKSFLRLVCLQRAIQVPLFTVVFIDNVFLLLINAPFFLRHVYVIKSQTCNESYRDYQTRWPHDRDLSLRTRHYIKTLGLGKIQKQITLADTSSRSCPYRKRSHRWTETFLFPWERIARGFSR